MRTARLRERAQVERRRVEDLVIDQFGEFADELNEVNGRLDAAERALRRARLWAYFGASMAVASWTTQVAMHAAARWWS